MGSTNSKTTWTNHYEWLIRNTEPQLGSVYYTLFWRLHNCVAPFTSHVKLHEFGAEKNQFPELNRHILTFQHYILLSGVTYWARVEML